MTTEPIDLPEQECADRSAARRTTPIDLDAAQALADNATPGPWYVGPGFATVYSGTGSGSDLCVVDGADEATADAEFIAQSRTLVPALIAELRRIRSGAKTLGETLHHINQEVLDAVGAHDCIGADGDGDWAGVYELLAELRPDRDQWKARAEKAESAVARVTAVAEDYEHAYNLGQIITHRVAASDIRAALRGGA